MSVDATSLLGFESKRWLSFEEVAALTGFHRQTVGNWYRAGDLPGVKPGGARCSRVRIPVEAVQAYMSGDEAALRRIRQALEKAQKRQRVTSARPRKPRAAKVA